MLKTRVLTALLLLTVLLPSLFLLPQWAWALLIAVAAGIAGWEWGGFVALRSPGRYALGVLVFCACAGLLLAFPAAFGAAETSVSSARLLPVYGMSAVFWLLLVPVWLSRKFRMTSLVSGALVAMVTIVPTWAAIVQLRLLGPWTLLAILAGVWIADIGAYFFGRLFGRHKLAINISPGKTWEGAIGGGILVMAYGLVIRQYFSMDTLPVWGWITLLAVLTAFSVVGDLFESMLKRSVGLKDSSQILPGHGGVLDRIDSLTSTLPLSALIWLLLWNARY